MFGRNKITKRSRQYFYITEDQPLKAVQGKRSSSMKVQLPRGNPFFIDLLDQCHLRVMTKVENRDSLYTKPLFTQKYGNNIITNIEDSSPSEQKLTKFLEDRTFYKEKKLRIRQKVKNQLDKSKQKMRSYSLFAIKQGMLDFYNLPVNIEEDGEKDRKQKFKQQAAKNAEKGLRKLGLLRHF